MKRTKLNHLLTVLLLILSMMLSGCALPLLEEIDPIHPMNDATAESRMDEAGRYSDPDDVAAYLHEYGKLPSNFITKREAAALGWKSSEGNLWEVTDQLSIGGDTFGNREGRLPSAAGRKWYECDVNYTGGYRGAERIVYSNDGLIYYTDDHYETFTLLFEGGKTNDANH